MNALNFVHRIIIPAALWFLPPGMNSREAIALLLAIGLQESKFEYRAQVGGPAQGFWQFESGGGWKGVLRLKQTKGYAENALLQMAYGAPDLDDYYAIENNDVLACVFARLLLWSHPKPLPGQMETEAAWQYYLATWRPGKPHRATWGAHYAKAWSLV